MSVNKLQEIVKDREDWHAVIHVVAKSCKPSYWTIIGKYMYLIAVMVFIFLMLYNVGYLLTCSFVILRSFWWGVCSSFGPLFNWIVCFCQLLFIFYNFHNKPVRNYNDFYQTLNIFPRATGISVFLAFNILNLNLKSFALCPDNSEEIGHQNCLE